jgi:hypothetical protein
MATYRLVGFGLEFKNWREVCCHTKTVLSQLLVHPLKESLIENSLSLLLFYKSAMMFCKEWVQTILDQ